VQPRSYIIIRSCTCTEQVLKLLFTHKSRNIRMIGNRYNTYPDFTRPFPSNFICENIRIIAQLISIIHRFRGQLLLASINSPLQVTKMHGFFLQSYNEVLKTIEPISGSMNMKNFFSPKPKSSKPFLSLQISASSIFRS